MAPSLNAIGLVVADMGRSLAFYRRLDLDIPESADAEPHVEVQLPGGLRLLVDTVDTVRSFDPGWSPARGGPRTSLAFQCAEPAEVDRVYADLARAGYQGHAGRVPGAQGAVGCRLGSAVRHRARPGRQRRGPVRR